MPQISYAVCLFPVILVQTVLDLCVAASTWENLPTPPYFGGSTLLKLIVLIPPESSSAVLVVVRLWLTWLLIGCDSADGRGYGWVITVLSADWLWQQQVGLATAGPVSPEEQWCHGSYHGSASGVTTRPHLWVC